MTTATEKKKRGRPRIHEDANARHKAFRTGETRARLDVWIDPRTDKGIKQLAAEFGVSRSKIIEAVFRFDGNLYPKIKTWL